MLRTNLPAINLFVACIVVFGATTASSSLAADKADPVVKAQLQSKGIKFTIDKDGDFNIVYNVHDGRTQLAYVRSVVNSFGTMKVREIWSPGFKNDSEELPALIANSLLDQNRETKLGAWETQGRYAVFVARIPADANADQLVDALELAVNSADALEEELTGKKDEL